MKQIALVTYHELPSLTPSDQLLREALAAKNIATTPVFWDDQTTNWNQFDAVLIRTCWDYHERPTEFKAWVNQLLEQGVNLYNTPQTLLWNMEKTYLKQLAEAGIGIIPTHWVTPSDPVQVEDVIKTRGWEQALLKPVFGAGSKGIHVIDTSAITESQQVLNHLLTLGHVMIQPIVKEVRNGELSLVFFNHEYSHTIRKTPQGDAILLDPDNPNATQLDHAPQAVIETATKILDKTRELLLEDKFLYARVDGVIVNDEFLLMELELLEPHLFLDLAGEQSAKHFSQAIFERLNT